MADSTCQVASFGVCGIRVARLDASGVPMPGAKNLYLGTAPIQVKETRQVKAGARFEKRNGCGGVCVVVQEQDDIQGMTLAMTLCQLDAELIQMLAGGSLITVGSNTLGYMDPALGQQQANGVSFEIWSENHWGGSKSATYPYIKRAYPRVTWRSGDETYAEDITEVPLEGTCYENPNFYNGPGNDWPTPITSIKAWILDTSIPTPLCGAQTLPGS